MELNSKIYVAGHRGLVGSAIWRTLEAKGYTNLIGRTHAELDLTDAVAVRTFFEAERPEYVFLAAAHVGGIIQQHVIGEAYRTGVKKLLFLGSTCIYPKEAPQPMPEDCLLTSPLEYTNEPYAIAKIAGLKLCESFNLQYGTNFIACMPTNLYGPNDNFDLERSHVLPAMMRKLILADALLRRDWASIRADLARLPISLIPNVELASEEELAEALAHFGIYPDRVELWGSGTPMREFLWSEDMAEACVFLMEQINFDDLRPAEGEVRNCHINIGTGTDVSIAELASRIKEVVGYHGEIRFDRSKPDGTMKKLTDPSKLHRLGWHHKVELDEGLQRMFRWYQERH